jgi:hypothetical protein
MLCQSNKSNINFQHIHATSLERLGDAHFHAHDVASATACYTEMLRQALVMCERPASRPSGLEHKIQALGRLGDCDFETGRFTSAIDHFGKKLEACEQLVSLKGSTPEVRRHMVVGRVPTYAGGAFTAAGV